MKIKLLAVFMLLLAIFYFLPTMVHGETVNTPHLNWFMDRCAVHNVPLEIALAVAIVETNIEMVNSNYNRNGSYDIGIFQLNSHFIEWFEEALWYDDRPFNAKNPENNIEMGIIYLRHLYKQTGNWDLAVRAYNTGLHALAYDPERSNNYLVKVITVLNTLELKK